MNKKNKISREVIQQLGAMTTEKIIEQLATIQPLSPGTGAIFAPNIPEFEWTEWRKTTSIWPRRSINDKIIFGRINKRSRPNYMPIYGNQRRQRIREFATNKELFESRLRGDT